MSTYFYSHIYLNNDNNNNNNDNDNNNNNTFKYKWFIYVTAPCIYMYIYHNLTCVTYIQNRKQMSVAQCILKFLFLEHSAYAVQVSIVFVYVPTFTLTSVTRSTCPSL